MFYPHVPIVNHDQHLKNLEEAARAKGLTMDTSSNLALAESLDAAVDANDGQFNRIIRMMATRCMELAVYFCTGDMKEAEWQHYGLGLTHYTHFTSPIRRYADLVVHRLLIQSLLVEPNLTSDGAVAVSTFGPDDTLPPCTTGEIVCAYLRTFAC